MSRSGVGGEEARAIARAQDIAESALRNFPHGTVTWDRIAEFINAVAPAILSAESRARPQWQPIETCPKDGTAFLVCHGSWMTVAAWHRRFQYLVTNGPIYDRFPADESPTHWQALPLDPIASGEGS